MSYVYVMTNEWFPGLAKLGSTLDVGQTFQTLKSVLPGKSHLNWHRAVRNCSEVERQVSSILSKFAVKNSPDWFSCPADVVIEQLRIYIDKIDAASMIDDLQIDGKMDVRSVANLGAFCLAWRKKAGMTQRDFADYCNVGVRFISEFERGKSTCQIDLCIKVAGLLGIDLFAVKR